MSDTTTACRHVVGCDVGKDSIVTFDSRTGQTREIANRRRDLAAFVARLPDDCLVVCEATGGWETALLEAALRAGVPAHRADARKVKAIGTYRGDARDRYLTELGFTNLQRTSSDATNYRKLEYGRLDLIVGSNTGLASMADCTGIDPDNFEAVLPLKEVDLYVALSRDTAPETVMAWQRAFRTLRDDGTLADILDRFQIVGKKDLFPSQLSGGQQQLVGVARAVVAKPKLILADEPTGNLHSQQAREIMELFTRLNREGTTIIQVTHSDDNARYSHRIVQLKDGWVVGEENPR